MISITKSDLASAFDHLGLHDSSRYMTAFQSDTKIKTLKRLLIRTNSAAEKSQNKKIDKQTFQFL